MSEIHQQPELSQDEILEGAIERLSAGESLDSILTSSGSDAEWLEPMLIVAGGVRDLRETVPVPSPEASLAAFLAEAERMAPTSPAGPAPRPWWERLADSFRLPAGGFPRLATTAVATLLAVFALMVSSAFFLATNAAAQGVLPGQPLYPIKRLGEEMVLRLPQSGESRDSRSQEFEERRRDEVHLLLDHRLEARVVFRGEVKALSPDQIAVDGIFLQVTDRTQIEDRLAVGAQVLVVARTVRDGALIAQRIVVVQPAPPTPSPTATPTWTPSATPTPTQEPTPTPEPTATPTSEPTNTPDHSASDIREPASTPTPILSPPEETPESPEEGEGENDNGGEGENENEDEDGDDGIDNGDDGGDGGDGSDNGNDDSDQGDDSSDSGDDGGDDHDGANDNEGSDDSDSGDDNEADDQDSDDDDVSSAGSEDDSNDSDSSDAEGSEDGADDNADDR